MATDINHLYKGFQINWNDRIKRYRVIHPQDPKAADSRILHPNLKTARAYIDMLWELMINPLPEPSHSLRLEPFYRATYREDGELQSPYLLQQTPPSNLCAHVMCDCSEPGRPAFRYCGQPIRSKADTRCLAHSEWANRGTTQPPLLTREEFREAQRMYAYNGLGR